MTKTQRWFLSLKPGDRVMARFPWNDRRVAGGRRVLATVGRRVKNPSLRIFHYRREDGSRFCESAVGPFGCYFQVCPVGFEVVYQPSRGYLFRKLKAGTPHARARA